MHFDAQGFELFFGLDGQIFRVSRQHVLRAFDEDHARFRRVDVAEVVGHEAAGDVADGSGEFDAGWAAADDDEVERRVRTGFEHFALGELEREQNAAANLDGIFDGLQAGRERLPLIVAEVRMGCAGSQHQVVVRHVRATAEVDLTVVEVEADGLVHEDFGVGVVAQDGADGRGDIGRREHGETHLVEQRLEGEVIAAVDHGDVDGQIGQRFGGVGSGEARTDDDDAWTVMRHFSGHCSPSLEVRRSINKDAPGIETMEPVSSQSPVFSC